MADKDLQAKIKKLAQKMEEHEILDHELQGRMATKLHRDIFLKASKHHVKPKKKYTYIDHDISGKFLVQNADDKIAKAGRVWRIKAYGQKNLVGSRDIDDVMADYDKKNMQLVKNVMDRSLKRRKK